MRGRWLRAKAWRLARRHYMLSFTAIALAVAGAGAMGYFDHPASNSEPPSQAVAPTRTPAPTISPTPDANATVEPLTVTYYLVDNEQDMRALELYEDGLVFREILEKEAIEVLLIRNQAEQAEADRVLEAAKTRLEKIGFILVVQDLRQN